MINTKKIKEFKRIIKFIVEELKEESLKFYFIGINLKPLWSEGNQWKAKDEESLWNVDLPFMQQLIISSLYESDLSELAYLAVKRNKKNKPIIELIYVTRSLTPKNEHIKLNIEEDYLKVAEMQIKIKELIKKEEIIKHWNKIIGQEVNSKEHTLIYFRYGENSIYGRFADWTAIHEIDFGILNIKHKHAKISSSKIENWDKYILINLWRIFMQLNELVQWKGKIYKKKPGSMQSYEVLGELEDFLKDTPFILMKLQENFPIQLGNTDINKLISDYYEEAYKVVEKIPNILVTKVIKEKTIEYKNGLYDEEGGIFLSYENERQKTIAEQWGTIKQKEEEYEEEKE